MPSKQWSDEGYLSANKRITGIVTQYLKKNPVTYDEFHDHKFEDYIRKLSHYIQMNIPVGNTIHNLQTKYKSFNLYLMYLIQAIMKFKDEYDRRKVQRNESSSIKLKQLLNEMPTLTRHGKKVLTHDKIELKRVDNQELEDENIVLFHNKKDTFFAAAGWFMVWMFTEPNHGEKMNAGETDMLIFPPRIHIFKDSPIDDIWKKRIAGKNTDKIIGACQGWVNDEKKEVLLNMLSVRPGWKRNGVATHIITSIKKHWSGYKIRSSELTKDGEEFWNSKPEEERPSVDFKSQNAWG